MYRSSGDHQARRRREAPELLQRLVRRNQHPRSLGTDQDGALAPDGGRLCAVAHRKYITPVPRRRSTALTIWSPTATRRVGGNARIVSFSSPFTRWRNVSH